MRPHPQIQTLAWDKSAIRALDSHACIHPLEAFRASDMCQNLQVSPLRHLRHFDHPIHTSIRTSTTFNVYTRPPFIGNANSCRIIWTLYSDDMMRKEDEFLSRTSTQYIIQETLLYQSQGSIYTYETRKTVRAPGVLEKWISSNSIPLISKQRNNIVNANTLQERPSMTMAWSYLLASEHSSQTFSDRCITSGSLYLFSFKTLHESTRQNQILLTTML